MYLNLISEPMKIPRVNYGVNDDTIFLQTFEKCLTDFLFMRKLELLRITIQCRSADILSALQLQLYTQD